MQKLIGLILILVVLGVGGYYLLKGEPAAAPIEEARLMGEDQETETPTATGNATTFEGVLEEVNTGCYADAECYVVVDGKHVTTLMGWSRDTVGTADFDALYAAIGQTVEVYAQENSDGTYTLYGSTDYYVRVK